MGTDLLIPLAAQLGAFAEAGGSGPGAADGSDQPDPAELAAIAPLVQRLGQLLASPDPSPEETAATVERLLDQLADMGVTEEMIRERATSLGIPLEELRRPER